MPVFRRETAGQMVMMRHPVLLSKAFFATTRCRGPGLSGSSAFDVGEAHLTGTTGDFLVLRSDCGRDLFVMSGGACARC